jgi:uncharacterized membrane protein
MHKAESISPFRQEGEGPVTRVNVGRLTNGIFAFTLLYLFKNIYIPNIFDVDTPDYFSQYIRILIPEAGNFINAFLIIAIIWILTFHIFHLITKITFKFLFIHFGLLMSLVFIPVSSMLADDFPKEPIFSLLLHLNIIVICLFLLVQWQYISGQNRLLHHTITREEREESFLRILILTGSAFIGGYLAISDIEGTRFVYLLVPIFLLIESTVTDGKKSKRAYQETSQNRPFTIQKSQSFTPSTCTEGSTDPARGPVGLDMLETLINGVFAFTMTLIVKNIPLPKTTDAHNIELMIRFCMQITFDAIEFILVFIIIAFFWMFTFQILRWMKKTDMRFVYLTFFELLLIAFIPITSRLVTFFNDQTNISAAFGINIILCSLILIIEWYYISKRTTLLNDEASDMIKNAQSYSFLGNRISIKYDKKRKGPFFALRNRLLILPVASFIWIIVNTGDLHYALIPILIGVCYLISRSWDDE